MSALDSWTMSCGPAESCNTATPRGEMAAPQPRLSSKDRSGTLYRLIDAASNRRGNGRQRSLKLRMPGTNRGWRRTTISGHAACRCCPWETMSPCKTIGREDGTVMELSPRWDLTAGISYVWREAESLCKSGGIFDGGTDT